MEEQYMLCRNKPHEKLQEKLQEAASNHESKCVLANGSKYKLKQKKLSPRMKNAGLILQL